ncbi:hypothetical protein FAES_2846 [Fibrella aestuarina BUZ 2]|uniref:Uncharacterized protein n=2 Tax=Fibrella TaxID=861914 RepID=I0K9Q2_9BACT|nr:hypothetical protein FAES_2846 [Fibrella aestuarina BUZ 2]
MCLLTNTIMNWLAQLLRSKTVLTLSLNCLMLAGFMTLRMLQPAAAQRPTLTLPHNSQLSVANWVAARLADVASLVETILRSLL